LYYLWNKEELVPELNSKQWDQRFLDLASLVASWSKDRSRKVGAVIVGPAGEIRSTGYNGFPRNVADDVETRHQRPAKYQWTEHAERNAIYNAARHGTPLEGCVIYLPWFPCMDCARAIVQSGIKGMVSYKPDLEDPKFGADFKAATEMFNEVGMEVRHAEGECPKQV
jgi:dCMP deaminase